jgi:hypothetical protein
VREGSDQKRDGTGRPNGKTGSPSKRKRSGLNLPRSRSSGSSILLTASPQTSVISSRRRLPPTTPSCPTYGQSSVNVRIMGMSKRYGSVSCQTSPPAPRTLSRPSIVSHKPICGAFPTRPAIRRRSSVARKPQTSSGEPSTHRCRQAESRQESALTRAGGRDCLRRESVGLYPGRARRRALY